MRRWFGALCALAVIVTACTKTNTTETTVASTSSTVVSTTAATTTESTLSAPDTVNPALLEAVPIDPKVRIGTLENGLTYYIRFNDSPGGRAELRLAVDAGSVLEDDDQSGGAHFLEHMMFNGTEQYPANDLIAVLEAFGPQFGPDINAYTSFDETVYELSVPTDNPAILLEAMKVLVQWAAHATLMQDDVEGERGVVVEEWRVRDQGLGGRISSVFGELVLTGTAYEGQEPIGEFDSISQMDAAPLRRFYQDWYQPELMAVVVVGDVDVDEVESLIEQHFGALQGPDVPLRRPGLTVNAPTVSEVATLADPEATSPSVDIFYMVDGVSPIATVGDLQNTTALAIAMQILETRLIEDALGGDVPFFAAATFEFFYSRAIAAHGLNASADASELESTARSLLREVARTSEFGFTDTEFDRARRLLEALNEQLREGQESRQDAQFAASYVAHFLAAAPIPSVDQLYDIQRESLARITLAEVEAAFVDLVSASAPRIFVVGPDEPAGAVPSESTLLALDRRGRTADPRTPTGRRGRARAVDAGSGGGGRDRCERESDVRFRRARLRQWRSGPVLADRHRRQPRVLRGVELWRVVTGRRRGSHRDRIRDRDDRPVRIGLARSNGRGPRSFGSVGWPGSIHRPHPRGVQRIGVDRGPRNTLSVDSSRHFGARVSTMWRLLRR